MQIRYTGNVTKCVARVGICPYVLDTFRASNGADFKQKLRALKFWFRTLILVNINKKLYAFFMILSIYFCKQINLILAPTFINHPYKNKRFVRALINKIRQSVCSRFGGSQLSTEQRNSFKLESAASLGQIWGQADWLRPMEDQ